MVEATLAKGVIFGICYTTGCNTSGTAVRGVAGQANMWGPGDPNSTHRCTDCHALIKSMLLTALFVVKTDTGIVDDREACLDETFVNVGKTILAMDLAQLRGAKL